MKKPNIKVIIIVIIIIIIVISLWYIIKNNFVKEEIIEYTPASEITEEQARQTMVSLYYKNKETNNLMPEARMIDAKVLSKTPYITLVSLLIENPKNENLQSVIPEGTKINKADIKGDVIYLDLSQEFIDNHIGGIEEEKNTINSIVNTLTELIEVNGVKFLINGEENKAFKDNQIKFDKIFTRQG